MKLRSFLAFIFMMLFVFSSTKSFSEEGPIVWREWSDQIFEEAAKENKMVILDLEAVWCHWCHVMADTTYKDPKVVELIRSKFIAVRVDQDANPDISVRYEQWGWPATILFSPQGAELVKRRGYIPPEKMASLLDAVIKDPTPGPSVGSEAEDNAPSDQTFLTPEQRGKIEQEELSFYDAEYGGWGQRLKLIDPNYLEWTLIKAFSGDKIQSGMARRTLDQALGLLDPVWGGFYQYSEDRDWKAPHYEKIMSIQAPYMKLYSRAYAIWQDPAYLAAAKKTAEYVSRFWTAPEGVFYTSQDADVDALVKGKEFYAKDGPARDAFGKAPRIDQHIYSRENGWMISSLLDLYDVTGEDRYRAQAKKSAAWILQNRSLPGGGFRHDTEDRAGPYLGDTLAMGQAFLDLYRSSAEVEWLVHSEEAAQFMQKNFKGESGAGFITAQVPRDAKGVFSKPLKQIDENVSIARFSNLLFHYTGKEEYRGMATDAMKYLVSPSILEREHFLCGVLIADHEVGLDPAHVTILGKKDDPAAVVLFAQALGYPTGYKRVEWWDQAAGPLPNPDVEYPELEKAAAFLCANKACSTPMYTPEKLKRAIFSQVSPAE